MRSPIFIFISWLGVLQLAVADDDEAFFESKIAPLLEARCLKCHSHAAGKMKGGLTLDSQSGWSEGGDTGPAITPGKPDESLLIEAVRYIDPDLQMPPKEKLTAAEVALLEEWVKRGAPDPRQAATSEIASTDWWSLKPLFRPDAPADGHPIDAFVRVKTAEADRRTLIRRLYFDLHGLPPTPEAVEAFVADPDPLAYDKLVQQLLESPRYGERWARHWLDTIHFADSHGCEHDVKRDNAWRFRDYVIDRFNADVSWARFIREQLAADALFLEEPELTAALGFVAAGPLELSRAGTAPVTFDYLDRDDIVTQTMAAFVSTTANCARCHTHKFDPITQEDYYALQAVFAGVGKGDIEFDTSAEVMSRRREMENLLSAAAGRNAAILLQPKYVEVVRDWELALDGEPAEWSALAPDAFLSSGGATLTRQNDGSIFADGKMEDTEIYTVTSSVELNRLTALRLETLKDERLPMGGPGRAGNGNLHLSEVELKWFPAGGDKPETLKIAQSSADYDQPGWTSVHAIDGDLKSGWAIFPKVNESHHIVFELAESVDVSADGKLAVVLKQLYPPKHYIGRFRLSVTDAEGGAARVLPADAVAGLKKMDSERSEAERTAIAAVALEGWASKALEMLPAEEVVYGVSTSWSHAKKLATPQQPKTVHLLRRGNIESPLREVSPGALSAIAVPFDLEDPSVEANRRVALANWIASPDNPLTWRSVVNRVWHYHFGRGICDTPNDFGRMGSEPSNQQLLDWLAVWFRDDAKGSLKELHRLILTSETWKQSGGRRIDAEMFRDSVLQITGKLDLTMGGPGIEQFTKSKGQQSTPKLDYAAFDWNSPEAERRSIYRVVWRGIPDPFMEALNFPDLGLLSPKREFSVSALQSLALYNNDFVLHASEWFAARLEREEPNIDGQIRRAISLAYLRNPTADEAHQFASYAESHGLAALCRLVLNSNEFLFID